MAGVRRRVAILVSGRGSNMEAILKSARGGALSGCCDVRLVLSNRPDAEALGKARSLGFPVDWVDSKGKDRDLFDREVLARLAPLDLDYVVLAGFMRVLSPEFVRRYPCRIVNIHPADTRQYRGLHGYKWAFEKRLPATKITVHLVDEGLDTGPIIAQADVDLSGVDSLEEVERRGLAVEHRFYGEVLRDLFSRADRPDGGAGPGAGRGV